MTKKHKAILFAHLLGLVIFVTGLFLPYSSGLTLNKLNESSVVFEFAKNYYHTTILGFESFTGRINIIIVLLLSTLFFLKQKRWFKYLLIPIIIFHLLSQLSVVITTIAGFGKPIGDSTHVGFALMFLGTVIGMITIVVKPTKDRKKYSYPNMEEIH